MLNRNSRLPPSKTRTGLWSLAALLVSLGTAAGIDLAVGHAANTPAAAPGMAAPGKPAAGSASPAQPAAIVKIGAPQETPAGANQALIARGKYLTTAADCMPCHSAPGYAPYSGGLSIVTPFGTMYSLNITPDKRTGIGTWTDHQFWDALHHGITRGRSLAVFPNYIYPAMPYTSYSKLSYQDVMAIKAYLFSLKPVYQPPHPNSLYFPFNIRAVLLGWRVLFFHPQPIHYAKNWSPAVRNGAYIAEALAHCGECHSPRNLLFAVKSSQTYAGTRIVGESWYAPNISSSKRYGVGGWAKQDLVSYLHNDGNMVQGSAFGPMQSVVDYSLSQMPKSDSADLADYLQQATAPRHTPQPVKVKNANLKLGAKLYAANCQGCHQATGKGMPNMFPNLAGNQVTWNGPADNIISPILAGLGPWHPNGAPMPAFGSALNDHEIAAIANYVRTTWGNPGPADVTAAEVLAMRATAPPTPIALADADFLNLPPAATAAARRFDCPQVSASGDANLLAAPGSGWMSVMRDATPETLPNKTRQLIDALKSSDATISPDKITNYLIAAYCPIVAHQDGLSLGEKKAALARFIAGAQTILSKSGA